MAIIEVVNLKKTYATSVVRSGVKSPLASLFLRDKKLVEAVKDISFTLEQGELVGFIGPNGAGKSTTIKMIAGILTPTSGSIRVCGLSPQRDRIRHARNIGVVFGQRPQLWWDLPVIESFRLLKKIYDIDSIKFEKNLTFFSELLDLERFMMRPTRQLSLGERMRADIAAAFLHDPQIVFLDEPTVGLDVTAKRKMREFIQQVNAERKTTILLTTHDMQDIEVLSQRMVVINHGTIVFQGNTREMRKRYKEERVLTFALRHSVQNLSLGEYEDHCRKFLDGQLLCLHVPEDLPISDIVSIVLQQCDVQDIDIQQRPIEDIIEEVYDR